MPSRRPSTDSTKPRSFGAAVLGRASKRSNSQPSTGSTGSTTDVSLNRSATCRPPRQKPLATQLEAIPMAA